MRFASVLSRDVDATAAGHAVAHATRRELDHRPIDLACLFFSSHYAERSAELSDAVYRTLAPRVLVGCTGEGVIAGSEEIEQTPAVALWAAHLPDASLTPLRLSAGQDGDLLERLPNGLGHGLDLPVLLLLADPFSTPMDDVLSFLGDRAPGASAIGGLAGGGHDVGANRLLLNDTVHDGGLVGVAISGSVSVRTVVSQGCRPIGDRYVVTRADNNVIYELGGVPAMERLQSMFESLAPQERVLAQNALHLGIAIDEQGNRFERGDFLVRNLIGADRSSGSVAIGDLVKEGQSVQFQVRDAQSASEDFHLLLASARSRQHAPPQGALIFSCCGRGRGLFGRPHHDVTVLRERAGEIPIAGFFAQGEIGPIGGSNFLHGYTASVALFSEKSTSA
ncbi:MAG TPA: FIST N-terminal domain-containing protein [Nitrospiraceae bacterium]|nr:FIST N-terminal domain-containing protein [Nitrospiraceae bacterium]